MPRVNSLVYLPIVDQSVISNTAIHYILKDWIVVPTTLFQSHPSRLPGWTGTVYSTARKIRNLPRSTRSSALGQCSFRYSVALSLYRSDNPDHPNNSTLVQVRLSWLPSVAEYCYHSCCIFFFSPGAEGHVLQGGGRGGLGGHEQGEHVPQAGSNKLALILCLR